MVNVLSRDTISSTAKKARENKVKLATDTILADDANLDEWADLFDQLRMAAEEGDSQLYFDLCFNKSAVDLMKDLGYKITREHGATHRIEWHKSAKAFPDL